VKIKAWMWQKSAEINIFGHDEVGTVAAKNENVYCIPSSVVQIYGISDNYLQNCGVDESFKYKTNLEGRKSLRSSCSNLWSMSSKIAR
jgi:hypothetical protein